MDSAWEIVLRSGDKFESYGEVYMSLKRARYEAYYLNKTIATDGQIYDVVCVTLFKEDSVDYPTVECSVGNGFYLHG